MIKLRLEGKLSAKNVCLLAHWAHAAGAIGPCGSIAMAPGSPSGHYQRKLDKYLGTANDEKDLYWLSLPGKEKCDASRCALQHPVRPPHEALNEEVAGDTKFPSQVEQAVKEEEWATNYSQHPVVRASPPGTVYPFALYIDGVPFSKHDSFLGFWVYNLVSLKRVLVAVVRKSNMCDCGCKRWCSIFPILQFLLRSFRAFGCRSHAWASP